MERGLRALKAYRRAREQNKMPVLDADMLGTFQYELRPEPVLDSNTLNRGNGNFPPKPIVLDSNTHIAITIGEGAQFYPIGWWKPDWANSSPIIPLAALLARSGGALKSDRRLEA